MSHKKSLKEIDQLPREERQILLEASWLSLQSQLYQTVFNWTHDEGQTEEILHETLLRLWLRIKDISLHEASNLNGYLTSIARNVLIERQRAKIADSERPAEKESENSTSGQRSHSRASSQGTLSQRLLGILKFVGDPPNDQQVKDLIADHLIRKHS